MNNTFNTGKAEYCGDEETASLLLSTETALQCKNLARNITNFNRDSWNDNAKEMCESGIVAKFEQNPELTEILIGTNKKTLVECCSDRVWGNGIPLFDDNCLKPECWSGQGVLGEILEEVRAKLQDSELTQYGGAEPVFPMETSNQLDHAESHTLDVSKTTIEESRQPGISSTQSTEDSSTMEPGVG